MFGGRTFATARKEADLHKCLRDGEVASPHSAEDLCVLFVEIEQAEIVAEAADDCAPSCEVEAPCCEICAFWFAV